LGQAVDTAVNHDDVPKAPDQGKFILAICHMRRRDTPWNANWEIEILEKRKEGFFL
jgi:hypothetical protein